MAAETKARAPKRKKVKAKAPEVAKAAVFEWWAIEPDIPKREPTRATLTLHGKEAKRFAEVLRQVVDGAERSNSRPVLNCVQMQTTNGLRLVTADGYRLTVAEYRPGLKGAKGKTSNILARPALYSCDSVLAIAKVFRGTSPDGSASLEVKRDGRERTLHATNDKGEAVDALEQGGNFPRWRTLVPTEKEAVPAALNARYLQWVTRFCKAIHCNGDGIVIIRCLGATTPARFDASSDTYRGMAVVMPMYVEVL